MRKFEIVKDEFLSYGTKDIIMPKRSTSGSAGYDIFSPVDAIIPPHEKLKIDTNLKVKMNKNEFLMLCPRSSMGVRGITLANGVGIIDSDFYGNPTNDGKFGFLLVNNTDIPFEIKKHDKIGQGIFMKYLTVSGERKVKTKRLAIMCFRRGS